MDVFFRRPFRIEWGHCDPAGIVFAPHFLEMFSENTVQMFEFAGLPKKRDMQKTMGVAGYPLVNLTVHFLRSATYGDDIVIESAAPVFGKSSFTIDHRVLLNDLICVEGTEKRVWAAYDPDAPGRIKPVRVPQSVRNLFEKAPAIPG